MDDPDGPVVVKLGGSFAFSVHLRAWIEAIAACAGRVVIVPGGGPFADTVRAAQLRMGFDDRAAHDMAILAMEQYGRALASLDRRLSPADSTEAIRRDLNAGRVPVWMPARMTRRLFLVKHVEFRSRAIGGDDLAASGVVDKELARQLRMSAVDAAVFGPSDHNAAVAAIREGAVTSM
jgi:aspartokinase-like uncharacterized kinase